MILSEEQKSKKKAKKEDIDAALDKIFKGVQNAIKEHEAQKITLEKVDEVLANLFEAVNHAQYDGKKTKTPDFKRIINDEF